MTTTTQPGLFADQGLDKLVWNKSELVLSASYDQDKIIKDILRLHNGGRPFDADVTYSKGVFYRNLPQPTHKFDLSPQTEGVIEADARNLPVDDESFDSLMFDPPFKASNSKVKGIIEGRFTAFASVDELWGFYADAIREFWRVLTPKGILVVKCQDTVSSGKNHPSGYVIQDCAYATGFKYVDTFILLARSVLLSPNMTTQKHARKNHSYFYVFSKPTTKRG